MIRKTEVNCFVRRLVREFSPERVILNDEIRAALGFAAHVAKRRRKR